MQAIQTYWQQLMANPQNPKQAVFELLQAFAKKADETIQLHFFHHFEKNTFCPDFHIKNMNGTLGYVLLADTQSDLGSVLKENRLREILKITPNLLITNGLQWFWLQHEKLKKAQLSPTEQPSKRQNTRFSELLFDFLSVDNLPLQKLEKTSEKLAVCSRHLQSCFQKNIESEQSGKLWQAHIQLTHSLGEDLALAQTAKILAQGLTWSLFFAKLQQPDEELTLETASDFLPKPFLFLRDVLELSQEQTGKTFHWLLDEILLVLYHLEIKNWFVGQEADAVLVSFYENYTQFYEQKQEVTHLPTELAGFMAQASDQLLKSVFESKTGIANRYKVGVLDVSAGTGSFLVEIFKLVLGKIPPFSPQFNLTIRKFLLQKTQGIETEPVSYCLAQIRLYQYLKEQGYPVQLPERLPLYFEKQP